MVPTVEKGQRWEDEDERHGDRVVRVKRVTPGYVGYAQVEVVVANLNPSTIGRRRWLRKRTLQERYRLLSH